MKHYSKKSKSYSNKNKKNKLSRKNNSRRNNNSRQNNNSRKKNHSKKNYNSRNRNQKGGSDCSLATIKEPAFSVASLGNITGLDIPESRGVIYRPNCQQDTYQAMIP